MATIINDIDHLSISAARTGAEGADIAGALSEIEKVFTGVEREADMAFSPRFGYLTASPKYLGSGVSVSILLHLPYSFLSGDTFFWPERAERHSVKVETFCGGNLEHHGFYLVSGLVGFGHTAEEITASTGDFARSLVERETALRAEFSAEDENRMNRAMPLVLKNATRSHRLSYKDVLRFVSIFTIAMDRGFEEMDAYRLADAMPAMSSTGIMFADAKTYSINECEARRADLFADIVDGWRFSKKNNVAVRSQCESGSRDCERRRPS